MAIKHSLTRGVATAGGGVLVLGAGMAVGALAADMHASWAAQDALRAAAAVSSDTTPDLVIPRPVVVTRTVEEHVTPEPVVVHKKVYRTVRSGGGSSSASAPRRAPSSGSSKKSSGTSKPSRTVVAPAPAAPAPAPAKAPATSTSKTS